MAKKANITGATNAVAENYAAALFDLAKAQASTAAVNAELGGLAELVGAQPQLAALFAHRTIDAKRRGASIRKLLTGRVSDLTLRFVLLLNDKGRLDQLATIARAFDHRTKHAAGEIDVEVYTARPLDAGQLAAVASRITASLGKKAIVEPHVDESLIGGLRVRIGDRLIDGSVRARLRRLKRDLHAAGHEQLKSRAAQLLQDSN